MKYEKRRQGAQTSRSRVGVDLRRSVRSTAVKSNAALAATLRELKDANADERLETSLSERRLADNDYKPESNRSSSQRIGPLNTHPPMKISISQSDDTTYDFHGYRVFRGAVTISATLVTKVRAVQDRKEGPDIMAPIFNGDGHGNDNLRLQAPINIDHGNIDTDLPGLRALIAKQPELDSTTMSPWLVVFSKPGCGRQVAHTDWTPQENSNKSFACVIALQPKTTLDVWPGAGRILMDGVQRARNSGGGMELTDVARDRLLRIPRSQVMLNKGDVLIFRADCVHAGSAYITANSRLHAYFDSVDIERVHDHTWKINDNV